MTEAKPQVPQSPAASLGAGCYDASVDLLPRELKNLSLMACLREKPGTRTEMAVDERVQLALNGIVIVSVDFARVPEAVGSEGKDNQRVSSILLHPRVTTRMMWTDEGRLIEKIHNAIERCEAKLSRAAGVAKIENFLQDVVRRTCHRYLNKRPDVVIMAHEVSMNKLLQVGALCPPPPSSGACFIQVSLILNCALPRKGDVLWGENVWSRDDHQPFFFLLEQIDRKRAGHSTYRQPNGDTSAEGKRGSSRNSAAGRRQSSLAVTVTKSPAEGKRDQR